MSTPEGRVKDSVRRIIKQYPAVYTFSPVPMGIGAKTLDILGCHRGLFFAVETKAPGKKPTPLQQATIDRIVRSGGQVFVVDSTHSDELVRLKMWLEDVENAYQQATQGDRSPVQG